MTQKAVGWAWLVGVRWRKLDKVCRLWFGNQVEKFIKKFDLSDDEAKRLKVEIAEAGK